MNFEAIPIPILVTSLVCIACSATDLRWFRVPNALTLSLLASGLAYQGVTMGWSGLGFGLLGALFGFAALLVPYALGGMGAGDVKLLAGVGAWLGPHLTSDVLLAAAILGGAYALILAAATGRLWRTLADTYVLILGRNCRAELPVREVIAQPGRRRRLVPFAVMITLGLFATVLRS